MVYAQFTGWLTNCLWSFCTTWTLENFAFIAYRVLLWKRLPSKTVLFRCSISILETRNLTTLQRLPILSEIVGTFLDTPTPNRETHLTLLSVWDTSEECRTMKSSVSIQSWAWYLRFQLPVRFPTEEMEREVNSLIPETCQLGTWTTLKSWDVPFE